MGYNTSIPYVDSSWNFLRGCTHKSPGCRHCYAERVSARFSGPGEPYEGVAEWRNGEPRWTGKLRVIEKHLDDPLHWKKPRMTFVNSMSDTFHELVPNAVIDHAVEVMKACPRHMFLLFTKRPDRMKAYIEVCQQGQLPENVWVGTTVEDPERRYRIDILREIPTKVHFLSCEPLIADLGTVDLRGIDWVIVGGESGPHARPMHPGWVRRIKSKCEDAGVAFYFKQWGEWVPVVRITQRREGRSKPGERLLNLAGTECFEGEELFLMRQIANTSRIYKALCQRCNSRNVP
jgi:protein gp37